jgi:WD40 repeat protein
VKDLEGAAAERQGVRLAGGTTMIQLYPWSGFIATLGLLILTVSTGEAEETAVQSLAPTLISTLSDQGAGEMAFSPDGTLLGLTTMSFGVIVLDPLESREVVTAEWPSGRCCELTDMACAFGPDGLLFAASRNSDLVVLDVSMGEILFSQAMPDSLQASIGALAFTGDNGAIVFGGQMAGIWALDLESGSVTQSQAHAGSVVSIEPMLDGGLFAIGHFSGGVDVWDRESDSVLRTLSSCVSYSNATGICGSYLVTGCGAHMVKFWDIPFAGQPKAILERSFIAQNFSTAREAGILFAGSSDIDQTKGEESDTCELILYDVEGGRLLAVWRAHSNKGILQTAIAGNGELFASLGYDRQINVWRGQGD